MGASGKCSGLLRELFLQAAAHQLAQLEDRRIGDRVKDLESFLSPGQDIGLGEGLQVTRDIGLRAAGHFDQSADIHFAVKEGMNQPQPHRLRKHGKAAGDQLQRSLGEGRTFIHAHTGTKA